MSVHYVWNQEGRMPTVQHPSFERAQAEADRLAEKYRGQSFQVVKHLWTSFCPPVFTFRDIGIGHKFKHNGRLLVKIRRITVKESLYYSNDFNALRLAPKEVSGRLSIMADDSIVEPVDE